MKHNKSKVYIDLFFLVAMIFITVAMIFIIWNQLSFNWRIVNLNWKWKSLSHVQLFVTPRNSPGQNTGVGNLSLLQGIFPTQGSNPGRLHCRWILYQLSRGEVHSIILVSEVQHGDSIFLRIILHLKLLLNNGCISLCCTIYPYFFIFLFIQLKNIKFIYSIFYLKQFIYLTHWILVATLNIFYLPRSLWDL